MRSTALFFACVGLTAACSGAASARHVGSDASTDDASTNGGGAGGRSSGSGGSGASSSSGGTSGSGGLGSGAGGLDASSGDRDGGFDSSADASCTFGTAGGYATQQQVDLYGTTIDYFSGGEPLPAGRYRLTYVSGCMKYSSNQGWTIHAYPNGMTAAWWVVGDSSSDRVVVPPGTVGVFPGDAEAVSLGGAYTTFDECVAANLAHDAPVEFDFAGGKLGVWLLDDNYGDNLRGPDSGLEGGGSPRWTLTLLGACVSADR